MFFLYSLFTSILHYTIKKAEKKVLFHFFFRFFVFWYFCSKSALLLPLDYLLTFIRSASIPSVGMEGHLHSVSVVYPKKSLPNRSKILPETES